MVGSYSANVDVPIAQAAFPLRAWLETLAPTGLARPAGDYPHVRPRARTAASPAQQMICVSAAAGKPGQIGAIPQEIETCLRTISMD